MLFFLHRLLQLWMRIFEVALLIQDFAIVRLGARCFKPSHFIENPWQLTHLLFQITTKTFGN